MPIEKMFYFICKEQYINAKSVAYLVMYSRKLFLITLPLLFKKWVG